MNRGTSRAASSSRGSVVCASLLCVCVGLPALAGNGRWTSNGPFGGRVDSAVPGTLQPNTLYATAHRSVYRSNDGGNTWAPATAGLSTVTAGEGVLVAHPTQPGRLLLAGARGVFGTLDSGRTWLRKDIGLPTATSSFRTVDIAYAPSDPTRVFLATGEAGLFRSVDGGSTWGPAGGSSLPSKLDRVAVDPADPLKLLVWALERDTGVFPASLYRSINGGASFTPVVGPWNSSGPIIEPASLLAYNPNVPSTVFVSNPVGNYRSTDGGNSFLQTVSLPAGFTQRFQSLDVHPSATNSIVFGTSNGVLFSPDNGGSFMPRNNGLSINIGDPASIGPIIVDPASASRWIAFSVSGEVFLTTNAGTSWNVIGAGLRGTRIETVAVHPMRPQRVYAGLRNLRTEATSAALYLSDDFAQTWLRFNINLTLDTVNAIVFDPITVGSAATTRMFALGADFAPLGGSPSSYRGGVFRSSDGGVSWAPADNLIPQPETGPAEVGEVNAMLVDPLSAEGGISQILYFAANGRVLCVGNTPQLEAPRIWRSINGSTSWTPRDNLPIGGCQPRTMSIQPVALTFQSNSVTTLYAGTRLAGYCFECNDPVPTLPNGVFKTTNSGQEWEPASAGLPLMSGVGSVQNINSLIAIPNQPGTLFAALSDPTKPDEPGRVYKTINGGLNWVPADNGIANVGVRVLRVEPSNPGRVYAGAAGTDTSPGGVYFTDNGGLSWFSTSIGLPVDSAQSIAVSVPTVGPPTVHAGTDEGVWSLTRVPDADIDGPSDADEDLAPNSGDGNADGIADRLQADVATITIPDINPGAAKGGSGQSTISNIDLFKGGSSCQQIFDATAVDPELLPEDPGYRPNAGLIRFEFINCTSGQVLATFHNETFGPDWVFRRFGPALSGNALTLQWLGMGNGAIRNGRSFTLTLTDNGPGDLRSESGRILFIGGPVQELPLFNNGFE